MPYRRFYLTVALSAAVATRIVAADSGVALVRHAPVVNGTIDGSVQQMTPESATLNGGGVIVGDWLVPGTPAVRLNGHPSFGGTTTGSGLASPTNFTITLNGSASLGHLVTHTDSFSLPTVATPPVPTGTRTVTVNKSTESNVDFSGLRDLTLNGNVGQVSVPAGTYGSFAANGNSGFTLGVAGATQPVLYNFQHLTLNGNTSLNVVGPVVITLREDLTANGNIGTTNHPEWLTLRVSSGSVTLNGKVSVYGYVVAPQGTVTVNGNSLLVGGVAADRLVVNGNGTLRVIDVPPAIVLTAPADNAVATAPVTSLQLTAKASDLDGAITRVEFFAGDTKLGESISAPYQIEWTNIAAGTYSITAKATDNAGVATMSAVAKFVANAPPVVAMTAPDANSVLAAPATVTLSASASDADGTVGSVAFFDGATKLGEVSAAPYQLAVTNLPAGTHSFSAVATDNYGAATTSSSRAVTVEIPPTASFAAPATVARGAGLTLTATASDADGSIAKVEFYRGATLLGTVTMATGTPPAYVFTDSAVLPPGIYHYTVRSYDNLGLYTDSTTEAVTVLATLPYTADFEEAEGYALGAIGGQLGWTATVGTAAVTTDTAYNGVRSIALAPGTPPVRVAQAFAPYPNHDVVFMDFFARPVAESNLSTSTTFDVEGARFAFAQNGTNAVLNVFRGDGAGGGTWQPTAFSASIGADNQVQSWTRLTARLDFAHKTWDLYAGGAMVAADVPFRDATATYLASFAVRGDAATISRLDYIFAGADNPLFADTNDNGLDDAWETAHGLALSANNRTGDPDGDGIDNIAEFINGTDPLDYYNGVAPALAIVSGDNQTAPPSTFNPQPLVVSVKNAAGNALANAPISFAVTGGGGAVAMTASPGDTTAILHIRTGADGSAAVQFLQPTDAGLTSSIAATAGASAVVFHSRSLAPNRPPIVLITAPADNSAGTVGVPIQITAAAQDPDGNVTDVAFFANNEKIGEATSSPFSVTWTGTTPGVYSLTAIATDNAGATTQSSAVSVTLSAAIQVSLDQPAKYGMYSAGQNIALATTTTGAVTRVEYYANDALIGQTTHPTEAFTWLQVTAGNYTLKAIAYNDAGNSTTSDPVYIAVNPPPLYQVSFEDTEGYTIGSVDAQQAWHVVAGTATVSRGSAYSGASGLSLEPGAHASRDFPAATLPAVLFVDFYVRPGVGSTIAESTNVNFGPAYVTFLADSASVGEIVVGQITDGLSYTNTGATFPITGGVSDKWLHITVREDTVNSVFDVYVDGRMILHDGWNYVGGLGTLELVNGTAAAAAFDKLTINASNPLAVDQDFDGIDDAYERANGMDPATDDRQGDIDNDGVTNIDEYCLGTRANLADTDGDGLPDSWEVQYGTNPRVGEPASVLQSDVDHDGLTLLQEAQYGTDPNNADTDGDGISDGVEVQHHLNPTLWDAVADNDGDGISNADELAQGTDPNDYFNGVAPVITSLQSPAGDLAIGGVYAVKVTAADGTPLVNAPVTLQIGSGPSRFIPKPGSVSVTTSVVVRTDYDGIARANVVGGTP